jgi:PAS domain S-box-containing protein
MYAIALFGFRIFDPIPQARQTVIAQMHEGMLVLDPQGRVVDLNPAAKRILGMSAKRARGQPVRELLPAYPDGQLADTEETEIEINLGAGQEAYGQDVRHYALVISLLKDWHGLVIGRLVLLRDVTEQKRAQAQLLEQQRALAMFLERERLARELHDGIGQVLGYVKMQAQAARDQLAQDQTAAADSDLEKLVAVAQDAHADVREYLLGAKTPPPELPGFLPMLQEYLQRYSKQYGLRTEVIVPPEGIDGIFEPTVKAQLLRIIQEALTNARKHAQAQCVQVLIQLDDGRAQVIVQDDGVGFDPKRVVSGDGQRKEVGFCVSEPKGNGSVEILSSPGRGHGWWSGADNHYARLKPARGFLIERT